MPLYVDHQRILMRSKGEIRDTGIYVRAVRPNGSYGAVDIAILQRESLKAWLEEQPNRAVDTVMICFGHPLSTPTSDVLSVRDEMPPPGELR